MKQYLLFLLLLCFAACKKDTAPTSAPNTGPNAGDTTTGPARKDTTIVITGMTPTSGSTGTVVTITGSNFGDADTGLTVRFNSVEGTIQSVKPTEIKVIVPATSSGTVTVTAGNSGAVGPVFTYIPPALNAPYVSGDVTLHSQAEIDAFVALNKGKRLQISGSLFLGASNLVSNQSNDITSVAGLSLISAVTGQVFCYKINVPDAAFLNTLTAANSISIYSCAFTALSFNNLEAFSGSLTLSDMGNLERINIHLQPAMGSIVLSACPKLTDLSFLHPVTSATLISFGGLGATAIAMDQLTKVHSFISISSNAQLASLSFPSFAGFDVNTTTFPLIAAGIAVTNCPLLSDVNFKSLTSLAGKLTLRNLDIHDMTGFHALNTAGALLLDNNPSLADLHGLEQLSSLTLPGVNSSLMGGSSPISRVNGINISNNPSLTSLNGLQHITNIPAAYITGNPLLNDLCPFKASVNTLSQLPDYSYVYVDQLDQHRTAKVAALTLTNNGNYATTTAAIAAVSSCQ